MSDERKHNYGDLKQMQALPLDAKILMTAQRLKVWYDHYDGDVYLSFSGGKDSTVLRDIIQHHAPGVYDIPSVYVDTGLEYPEVRAFALERADVVLKPKMNFRQVIQTYGYPVVSKEIANIVRGARIGMTRQDGSYALRIQALQGVRRNKDGSPSQYNCKKWAYLLDAPFPISEQCCDVMKKRPAHAYEKETGRMPILATMVTESTLRLQQWFRNGCNAFEAKRPTSKPMSFWTEQDVLEYLHRYKLPYASVYGEIKQDADGHFYNTGVERTGCMFCAFGAHMEDCPNRFHRMKETHPKQYAYCMKPLEEGGLGMDKVLEYIGVDH